MFVISNLCVSTTFCGRVVQVARQLGTQVRNASHKAHKGVHNLGQEITANKGKFIKAGIGWGAISGAYYGGSKYVADFNPEVSSSYSVPQEVLNQAGLQSQDVIYVKPGTIHAVNPEDRWLANNKGFWGNLLSLISPTDPYMGSDGKLRVPVETAKNLSEGKETEKFLAKVADQKDRHATLFDWKTIAECAVDTAVWTPIFMLSPVVKTLRAATGVASYATSAMSNRLIMWWREKKRMLPNG